MILTKKYEKNLMIKLIFKYLFVCINVKLNINMMIKVVIVLCAAGIYFIWAVGCWRVNIFIHNHIIMHIMQ